MGGPGGSWEFWVKYFGKNNQRSENGWVSHSGAHKQNSHPPMTTIYTVSTVLVYCTVHVLVYSFVEFAMASKTIQCALLKFSPKCAGISRATSGYIPKLFTHVIRSRPCSQFHDLWISSYPSLEHCQRTKTLFN